MFKSLGLVVALLGATMGPPPPVALDVSPRFTEHHQPLKVTIIIPEDPTNREACLYWYSDNDQNVHCWEHDNLNDFPPRISYTINPHYTGTYEFYVDLLRTDKTIRTPTITVEVN